MANLSDAAGTTAEMAFLDGVLAQIEGALGRAEQSYRQVLAADPEHVGALHHLATVLVVQQRAREAVSLICRSLRLLPADAALWLTLGSALHRLHRYRAATGAFTRALAIQPSFPEADNLIGVSLLESGRPAEAVTHFERAIEAMPAAAEFRSNLGVALLALDRPREAIGPSEAALELDPGSARAMRNLGAALLALDREAAALGQFEAAARQAPDDADNHHGRGIALARLGRLAEAIEAIDHAIQLRPGEPRLHRARGLLGPQADHLASIENLADGASSLPPQATIELHFALGRAYAERGDHPRAMGHWIEGNMLKRREIIYQEAATLDLLDRIRRAFTPDMIGSRSGAGHASARPVFVIGMPRSGTTLVEQIIASHPRAAGAGEVGHLAETVADLEQRRDLVFPEFIQALGDDELRALGAAYDTRLGRDAPGATRVTDKALGNFRYVGLIHLALPQARIVHVRRDPLDCCLSCFAALFERSQLFSYDLAELGRCYRAYQVLMEHWRAVLPAGTMLDLDYEDLVADTEGQTRRVLTYLGLDWDPACLAFHRTVRPVRTASLVQVRQPIYTESIGRASAYLPYLKALIDALAGG